MGRVVRSSLDSIEDMGFGGWRGKVGCLDTTRAGGKEGSNIHSILLGCFLFLRYLHSTNISA